MMIEPHGEQHDRAGFSCGQPDLDNWFHHRASQDERRNVARVFVATDDALGMVGFYSRSCFTRALEDRPETIASQPPRYDAIPAAPIGRLARDERAKSNGIGELLLADAIRRILGAAETLAVFAIVVDAKDARASAFYAGFGFRPFPLRPGRLFLLASSAAAAVEQM